MVADANQVIVLFFCFFSLKTYKEKETKAYI